jgi:hypothetical protein
MDEEHISELKALISSEADGRPMILDLRDVTLVDQRRSAFYNGAKRTVSY